MMLVLPFLIKYSNIADELEKLDIKFNIALVPFFNEKRNLTSFPEFVEKINLIETVK